MPLLCMASQVFVAAKQLLFGLVKHTQPWFHGNVIAQFLQVILKRLSCRIIFLNLTLLSLSPSHLRSFSYRDQLAMLSESMMKERKECAIRGKAQNQVSQYTCKNDDIRKSLRDKGPWCIIGCSIRQDVKQWILFPPESQWASYTLYKVRETIL